MLIHEVDLGQIPGRVADLEPGEMAVAVGHLEAAALDDDGAVALPLLAALGAGEGQPQRGAIRAGPHHAGAGEEARDRRLADLGVELAIVLVLDPSLRRLIEECEGEIGHVLEHGDQPALDRSPEGLLLAVLIGE